MKKDFTKLFLALWVLAFIPLGGVKAQQTLDITGYGAEATDTIVPVHGAVFNSKQKSQMIYPAAKLIDLIGKEITKITLFTTEGNNDQWNNDIHIRMASTRQNHLNFNWSANLPTEVFVGKLVINSNNELIIELDTPFKYSGNNLLIEYDLPNNTSYTLSSVGFHGTTEATNISRHIYGSAYEYNYNGTPSKFLPKMRIEYIDNACPTISNLDATVNSDNSVTLSWTNPQQNEFPAECDGDVFFTFFDGSTVLGGYGIDDLTTWTTPVLETGTHSLGVSISYWKNFTENVCYTEAIYIDVDVNEIPVCQPVTNLSATENVDNTVTLEWTNPQAGDLPYNCSYYNFEFYDGFVKIGQSDESNLTSWTTPVLSNWNHTLIVRISYYDNNNKIICSGDAQETAWISGGVTCQPVFFTATVNDDNTVKLSWDKPYQGDLPEGCTSYDFEIFDENTRIGYSYDDNLTSFTTPVLSIGTHNLSVVIHYFNSENAEICFGQDFKTVTIEPINPEVVVQYDDGTKDKSIGMMGKPHTIIAAIRLTNDELANYYNDHKIAKIRYFIDTVEAYLVPDIVIKIFAHGTDTTPGQLLISAPVGWAAHGWNIYTFNNPLPIISGDYWVGYEVIPQVTGCPAGVSENSVVPGKGDWYYSKKLTDGKWKELKDILSGGDKYNWNIHVTLTTDTGIEDVEISLLSAEIYPNPAKDLLNIKCDSEIKSIELYDRLAECL